MAEKSILGIYRESMFSPGKISQDRAILDTTLSLLSENGMRVNAVGVDGLNGMTPRPDLVLSMAQSRQALDFIERWEKCGTPVVNAVRSVRNCYRKVLIRRLADAGVSMPKCRMVKTEDLGRISPAFAYGFWLKRGDVHAMQPADVVRILTEADLYRALAHFHAQGIEDILLQEHVEGRVIKFYGVGGGDFFFHAEDVGSGSVIEPEPEGMKTMAARAAKAADLDVYGGDAVLTPSDEIVLIDLNDWPSFSSCCAEAAQGIAAYIKRTYRGVYESNGSKRK